MSVVYVMFVPAYKRYALAAMTSVYTLNLVDRGLIVLLLQPIKDNLRLSDSAGDRAQGRRRSGPVRMKAGGRVLQATRVLHILTAASIVLTIAAARAVA